MKLLPFLLLALVAIPTIANSQGTAFTYQGQLGFTGQPADGEFDFQFVLFDSNDFVSGLVLAGPVTIQDHPVFEGNFSVEIDFGAGAFGGADVWLEVRLREGSSEGPFTTLAPREKITPAPLAIYASSVGSGVIGAEQLATGAVGSDQVADSSISSIDVDSSQIQLRIGDSCAPGSFVRAINSDGSVDCDSQSSTVYTAGTGLNLVGQEFNVDLSQVQSRVIGTCSENHYMVGIEENGSIQCASGPVDCLSNLTCPEPLIGKSCVAGRILEVYNQTLVKAANGTPGQLCGAAASGGVCDLNLELHDVLDFAANPGTSTPLTFDSLDVDSCGRFVFSNVGPPGSGFAVVIVDDNDVTLRTSAHIVPLGSNQTVEQVRVQIVRSSVDELWTSSAGSPFGSDSFADRGAILAQFRIDDTPRSEVVITAAGSSRAADDFYFSDSNPDTRLSVDAAQSSTSTNGAGLMVDSDLVQHSGQGGEFGTCTWPSLLADAIPGVITVVEFKAEGCN